MMTGQDTYKEFLNTYISPALRELGFSGSAGTYQFPNEDAYVLIGFQKSKWSTKETVEFTVNVSVIGKKVWDEARSKESWFGKTPSAISLYPIEMWSDRLSQIPLLGKDKWWKITTAEDSKAAAEDIIKRIKKHALPAITKQLSKLN